MLLFPGFSLDYATCAFALPAKAGGYYFRSSSIAKYMAGIVGKFLFPRYLWWVWLILPLTLFAFYPTYFSKLREGTPAVMHWHAGFMMVWIALLIIQPWLIMNKKLRLHRLTGRISYFVMPAVLLTAWMMMRFSYETYYLPPALEKYNDIFPARKQAIADMRIGVLYWTWLLVFYTLGIIRRKKALPHATYLFAALLTLLGPTVDRIMYRVYAHYNLQIDFAIGTFILVDLLLLSLAYYQYRRSLSARPALTAVIIYLLGQVLFYLAPHFYYWKLMLDPLEVDKMF